MQDKQMQQTLQDQTQCPTNIEDKKILLKLEQLTIQQAEKYFIKVTLNELLDKIKYLHFKEYEEFRTKIAGEDLYWLINTAALSGRGYFDEILKGKNSGTPATAIRGIHQKWQYMRIGFGKYHNGQFGHQFVMELWPPGLSSGYHHHGHTVGAVTLIKGSLHSETYNYQKEGSDYTEQGKVGPVEENLDQQGKMGHILPCENQVHNITNNDKENFSISLHGYCPASSIKPEKFAHVEIKGGKKDEPFDALCDYCRFITHEEEGQEEGTRLTEEFIARLIWEQMTKYKTEIPVECYKCPLCKHEKSELLSDLKDTIQIFRCTNQELREDGTKKCGIKYYVDFAGRKII